MITCLGFNHKTAPINLREKIVFHEEKLESSLQALQHFTGCEEAVILSTCHRTEIYANTKKQPENITKIIDWLSDYQQVKKENLTKYIYTHEHIAALKHSMRVASGLDSIVLGETQIFGQFKNAVNIADKTGALGNHLRDFFTHTFSSVKKIRVETEIGAHTLSLGQVVKKLAKTLFENVSECKVLLIGAGEIIDLVAKYLYSQQISQFWIANRTLSNAEKISALLKAKIVSLQDIQSVLPSADIIVSAVHHLSPVIGKGMVETALKTRKHKPMLMIDLAMPRNIEAEIKNLEDVYLYHLDDLQDVLNENYQKKQIACQHAEVLIEKQSQQYRDVFYYKNI
jgi:glutamyl-tRNA reductase